MTSSHSPESLRAPDIIQGSLGSVLPPSFIKPASFSPLAPAASSSYSPPLRPLPTAPGTTFRIQPSPPGGPTASSSSLKGGHTAKRKTALEGIESSMEVGPQEPLRKMHLSDDMVAQTMAELYISHPRPKVARRSVSGDVAEAMNLSSLEGLEDRFSHQAAINNLEDYQLPPARSRKVPSRRGPTLRLSIHQELKSLRTTNAILPESIMARYRPNPRTAASTAVVLWRPPPPSGSLLPDLVSSALRAGSSCGRQRTRCYSEVTSTPYSSHENLNCADSDMADSAETPLCPPLPCSSSPVVTAEAPELTYGENMEVPGSVTRQRRNSAPEISEPTPFVDDGSMEL